MLHHMSRVRLSRLGPMLFIALLAGVGLATAAVAATTPQSGTSCWGSLTRVGPANTQSDEPNLLKYRFRCDGGVTAYTIVVNRLPNRTNNIDDFEPNPLVLQQDGTASSTQSFSCAGTIPGPGFNCNAGPGGVMSAWNTATGSFDPVGRYCSSIPAGSKPGARPEPQAQVWLLVTNATGAQDGPFPLSPKHGCSKPKLRRGNRR